MAVRVADTVATDDLDITKISHADRLMLHATRLAFDHPLTGERIDWICDCPF